MPLDACWQLVHATHATPAEIDAVARSDAGIVLCPSTEANLGDGLFDRPAWLASGVPLSIGSDSQVSRGWAEELRLAEYGQRLALRRRNVWAAPADCWAIERRTPVLTRAGGRRRRSRLRALGLGQGARADPLVAAAGDTADIPPQALLDTWVFSSPSPPWRQVMVGGRWVVDEHAAS